MSSSSAVCVELCVHCFDSALAHLNERVAAPTVSIVSPEKFPLFITWKKRTSALAAPRLRGCIGTFTAKPLSVSLSEYAVISAFRDHRFAAVHAAEVPFLSVSVSLLVNFTPCSRPDDWIIGTHGITIDFTDRGQTYSGTYLPEVAAEQRWTHDTTLTELLAKCGWSGVGSAAESDVKRRLRVVRYESVKATMTHDEYLQWKRAHAAAPAPIKIASALALQNSTKVADAANAIPVSAVE